MARDASFLTCSCWWMLAWSKEVAGGVEGRGERQERVISDSFLLEVAGGVEGRRKGRNEP